ncbi:endonuclease V [Tundrisphaera sp. TA3]|uniref:endonuclease V n=1 Tax=Tundrisphaera sp. TA3 TaxID=3435775 RepID=UPI003EC07902
MIACVDVDYRDAGAAAACVVFSAWGDERSLEEVVVTIDEVEPYEPGQFFRRELPCLIAVLGRIESTPRIVLIDGYVWLGDEGDPGLGAHLHEAMGRQVAVIGVAKTRFLRARAVQEITRGGSQAPLFITAVGLSLPEAAEHVREMHGPFRIPTLLKRADQLCRGLAEPTQPPA